LIAAAIVSRVTKNRAWAVVGLIAGPLIVAFGFGLFASDPKPPAGGYIDAVITSQGPAGRTATLRVSDGRPVNATCTVRPDDFASGRLPAAGTFLAVERIGDRCHPRVYADRSASVGTILIGALITLVGVVVLWGAIEARQAGPVPAAPPPPPPPRPARTAAAAAATRESTAQKRRSSRSRS
jgi:hypothetical protein